MFHAYILPIATCFIYTLYGFYAFSGTNLLTRCHSASSLFSAVFGFRKAVKEIFSELHETKAKTPIFPGSIQNTEEDTEEGHEAATPVGGAAPLRVSSGLRLRVGKIGGYVQVSSNSENISRLAFLEYKNSRK